MAGRFFVYAVTTPTRCPPGASRFLIEATVAFGTGHHGTTPGLLRALDRMVERGEVARNVADIGCGTAVLAMAAAKVFPNPVLASDIDAVAVDVARANAEINGLGDRVICLEAAGSIIRSLRRRPPSIWSLPIFSRVRSLNSPRRWPRMYGPGGTAILSGLLANSGRFDPCGLQRGGFFRNWSAKTSASGHPGLAKAVRIGPARPSPKN